MFVSGAMNFFCPSQINHHHSKVHNNFQKHQYKCEICRVGSEKFKYSHHQISSLKEHVILIHKKELVEPPFKCQVCDITFILEEALHYHQKVEHDFKIECFECKECLR